MLLQQKVKRKTVTLILQVCTPFPEKYGVSYIHTIVLWKFFAYYSVPLCIIACFYIMMARNLEASAQNMPGENQGQIPQVCMQINTRVSHKMSPQLRITSVKRPDSKGGGGVAVPLQQSTSNSPHLVLFHLFPSETLKTDLFCNLHRTNYRYLNTNF